MSVREAQARISSNEFSEWIAYSRIEPFGEERADLRSAINTTVLANANRSKGRRAFKVKDFMPRFDTKLEIQSPKHMQAMFRMMSAKGYGKFTSGKK